VFIINYIYRIVIGFTSALQLQKSTITSKNDRNNNLSNVRYTALLAKYSIIRPPYKYNKNSNHFNLIYINFCISLFIALNSRTTNILQYTYIE